jgi:hypothetical protein
MKGEMKFSEEMNVSLMKAYVKAALCSKFDEVSKM